MIRSYGLHWHKDRVFWGHQNNSGSLMWPASPNGRPVDFRKQRGIYALYADYRLVYIGQTGSAQKDRLFDRLKSHLRDHLSERWDRFSWLGTQWVIKESQLSVDTAKVSGEISSILNILESTSIAISEPSLNLQRGRWGDCTQYYQLVSPDI